MAPNRNPLTNLTPLAFLGVLAAGLGLLALASLLKPNLLARRSDQANDRPLARRRQPAAPRRAKRVIWLYMAGGPSHLESFDHKPMLAEMSGKPMPESFTKGQPIAQLQGQKLNCFAPQHAFKTCGQSGQEISEIFPQLAGVADELCIVRSMKTEAINHDPAHTFDEHRHDYLWPAWRWVRLCGVYGLGRRERKPAEGDRPRLDGLGQGASSSRSLSRQWHSGFLACRLPGRRVSSPRGEPVLYVKKSAGLINDGETSMAADAV